MSGSFPSGHAASAAAVATAIALEAPPLAAPVGALAGAVGCSRVWAGVNHPTDVLAGFAIGTAATLGTMHWWPVRPPVPAAARPAIGAPALVLGEGLTVVINARAGQAASAANRIRRHLPGARLELVENPDTLTERLRRAAETASAVGVAGGDGTVRAAASVAVEANVPLAVFPAGTLNHFALDIGVSSIGATANAVTAGHAVAVELGTVNDQVFVNTASIGGYPELVRIRSQWQARVGRWPALGLALVRVLRDARPLRLRIDGVPHDVWLLFVGNGVYQPPGFAPAWRSDLVDGALDVRVVGAARPGARVRPIVAALTGTLPRARCYSARALPCLSIQLDEPRDLALDGEVFGPVTHAEFRKFPQPLVVYRPFGRDPIPNRDGLGGPR